MTRRSKHKVNEAYRLHEAGRFPEAESACRALLARSPSDPSALNLLGMLAARAGRVDESIACFRGARAAAPGNAAVIGNLAQALRLSGRLHEAIPLFREAIRLQPAFSGTYGKLALALTEAGRLDEAIEACRAGLRSCPEDPQLGGLLAELLIGERRPAEALPWLLLALERAPEADIHWSRLYRLLRHGFLPADRGRRLLLKALAHPLMRPSSIAAPIARTLRSDPLIGGLTAQAQAGALPPWQTLMEPLGRLSVDELLLELMTITVIPDPPLECLFTGLRRALLFAASDDAQLAPALLPFCAALATQAFLVEYAWFVTGEEETLLDALIARLEAEANGLAPETVASRLAIIGAYRALNGLAIATTLTAQAAPEPLRRVLRMQIEEPREERALRALIPALTPMRDPVSRDVRAQYEENPYPRWARAERSQTIALPELMRTLGATVPADPSFSTPEILVAGCGTGQHAISTAPFFANGRVLAIDLSLASLAYALRKTRELGITNIEYGQADILELGVLDRRFHVIESSGVLHHLADPLAGWRVLTDLLRPGGLMQIGLYSELARPAVVRARAHIAARGYQPTVGDIRRCRRDVLAVPEGDALAPLRGMGDFYSSSGCRDLLFHVQEHRFTIPQIAEALAALGLRFLGFVLTDTGPYRRRFPDDPRMRSLDNWHRLELEQPDTFVDMYQFWVQKEQGA